MSEAVHTPTPWAEGKDGYVIDAHGGAVIVSAFAHTVTGGSYIPAKQNNALILKAVNSHDALIEFFKASVALVSTLGHEDATVEDEQKAEARYDAALIAAGAAVKSEGAA